MLWQKYELRLAIFPIFTTLVMVGYLQGSSPVSNQSEKQINVQIDRQNQLWPIYPIVSNTDELSCVAPELSYIAQCEIFEQQILATVVRLEILEPNMEDPDFLQGVTGHGTIKDGRYIVVHNHFPIGLAIFSDEAQMDEVSLNLYSANGYMLLRDAHPPLFEIVVEDQETLVLDFGTNPEGEGFFDWFGVPSAVFKNIHDIRIHPGSEVAQVNWDGQNTSINWVKVLDVITNDGVPRLLLANYVNKGSSGGGVFWQGAHVANNWMKAEKNMGDGTVSYQFSIAALNSVAVSHNHNYENENRLRFNMIMNSVQ